MISDITKKNLNRDRHVQGKKWLSTYGNYFSDTENIEHFVTAVIPHIPDREVDILYVGSAMGLLGEMLIERLGRGSLTLVDASQEHLDQNLNPQTVKMNDDMLTMQLNRLFDVIIMRSSLHYLPSFELQQAVLENIGKHLKQDGLFFNQPAYHKYSKDRNLISNIYKATDKIGHRLFQSTDLEQLYQKAGFNSFEKIGQGRDLILSEREYAERYRIDEKDILAIQTMIPPDSTYAKVTSSGFKLTFEYPIFMART